MKDLLRRIGRIEDLKKPAEDDQIIVRFAYLKTLPRDHAGEKHEVLFKGWPSETPNTDCEIEERPGRILISDSRGDNPRSFM